jgi:hypothetical protein
MIPPHLRLVLDYLRDFNPGMRVIPSGAVFFNDNNKEAEGR